MGKNIDQRTCLSVRLFDLVFTITWLSRLVIQVRHVWFFTDVFSTKEEIHIQLTVL